MDDTTGPTDIVSKIRAQLVLRKKSKLEKRKADIEIGLLIAEARRDYKSDNEFGDWWSCNFHDQDLDQSEAYRLRRIAECLGRDWPNNMSNATLSRICNKKYDAIRSELLDILPKDKRVRESDALRAIDRLLPDGRSKMRPSTRSKNVDAVLTGIEAFSANIEGEMTFLALVDRYGEDAVAIWFNYWINDSINYWSKEEMPQESEMPPLTPDVFDLLLKK